MDLVQFLRARLDEEAELATAASPGPWHANGESDEVLAVDDITVAEGFALSGNQLRATVAHIARHDPARVLADVEAKRRILEEHHEDTFGCVVCANPEENEENAYGESEAIRSAKGWPCPTVRLLALPYADHPDYRDEWRP